MEATNAVAALAIANDNNGDAQLKGRNKKKSKKGRSSNNLWKAVLLFFIGRRRKTTKAIQAEVVSDANWMALVGCMRPMNLQRSKSTLMLPDGKACEREVIKTEKSENVIDEDVSEKKKIMIEEVNKLPASTPESPSSSSGHSRYASALNLQELDKSSSSDDEGSDEFGDTQGDAMIDMKAEMFIAQFYAQMRIQNASA